MYYFVGTITVTLTLIGIVPRSAWTQSPGRSPLSGVPGLQGPFGQAMAQGEQTLGRGDFSAAQSQFETAVRLNPSDPRPTFYLGEIAREQSHWPAAEGHFRSAIRLSPRMAEAHANLGMV